MSTKPKKTNAVDKEKIKEALTDVYDPEMHIDIVSLGLVYDIKVNSENDVTIIMTLTFPGCPYGPAIVEEVEDRLKEVKGLRNVTVHITFDPPWSPDKMDPDIKAAMGL
jgi:metal-sulfur cluster biosynthetic enzyme